MKRLNCRLSSGGLRAVSERALKMMVPIAINNVNNINNSNNNNDDISRKTKTKKRIPLMQYKHFYSNSFKKILRKTHLFTMDWQTYTTNRHWQENKYRSTPHTLNDLKVAQESSLAQIRSR